MNDGTSAPGDVTDRLVLLREWSGAGNQSDFARRSGFSAQEWNHFESGRRPLTIAAANKLKRSWRVTLDWLYHGERSGLSVEIASSLPYLDSWRQGRPSGTSGRADRQTQAATPRS